MADGQSIAYNRNGTVTFTNAAGSSQTTAAGLTQAQIDAAALAFFGAPGPVLNTNPALIYNTPQYVNNGIATTVANLLTNFTASVNYLGMLARVSDLWGGVATSMICEYDVNQGYYWRPQRTDYAAPAMTATSGGMTLTPLITAPVLLLTGTPTGNITVTPSSTNVWPGATFRITTNSVLSLYGITLGGLVGGGTVPLLTGGAKTLVYHSGSGWFAA